MKNATRLYAILFLSVLNISLLHAQVISTFAGGFGAGAAANAELHSPLAITSDHAGNIYIADAGNNIVRKIDHASGITTVIAGNGCNEDYGDSGPATEAAIYLPSGLAIDVAGNLYIADNENSVIRKVNTSGIITTIAGSGSIHGFSGDNGPAINALLNVPAGVAVDDSGNVYIADENNNRVRKINTAGIITTIAGTGSPGYSGNGSAAIAARLHNPVGVAVDGAGNIYVADMYNSAIRKINTSGIISTIAGNGTAGYTGDGGAATSAQLFFPTSVFVDGAGNVYIGDNQNNVIRKVDNSGIITTIAGNATNGFSGDSGPAVSASLSLPYGVTVDSAGNIYIADQGNNRVRMVNSSGSISTFAGPGYYSGDGGTAAAATLYRPNGITTAAGSFYIADTYNRRIRKVDAAHTISTIAGTGTIGNSGNGGTAIAATFFLPIAVAADGKGNIYILDTNNTVRKINAAGIISAYAGNGIAGYNGDGIPAVSAKLNQANGIAVDHIGNLYIADYGNNRIRKVDTAGIISTIAGNGSPGFSGNGGPAISAQLNAPEGVAVDNHGNVFIADYNNYMIRKVDNSGIISTVAGSGIGGSGGYNGPALLAQIIVTGVGVDNAGNILILNNSDDYVMEVDTSGIIKLIAGQGSEDYGICGENGIDSAADLSNPMGVATDTAGNIYLADEFNNRIRIIYTSIPAATPVLSAASESIVLFPNPANDFFTLKLPETSASSVVTIFNTLGQIIESSTIASGTHEYTYQLNNIPAGSYIVKVNTSHNMYWQKIVVIK